MDARIENRALEIWGGVECTVNRVGDSYLDQLELGGHAARLGDLELFAGLGLKTLRYPVIWERTAPEGLAEARWEWPDERLARLEELGIEPIAGLLHHGSGPRSTSLLDPAFPRKLASYARAVAERYPWVTCYTPINEPMTTARFSALYGHWYPHEKNATAFLHALINQCLAVSLAMREIRCVNPGAKLVQTDDLGTTYSSPRLAYQAEFENHRRWLSWDLLCGRVTREHPLWEYLMYCGVSPGLLRPLSEAPCPPDIVGINHYVTSSRFLDENVDRHCAATYGGNGRDRYADVEAVRVDGLDVAGVDSLALEAWRRYGLPIAITEAHLGCTREEQLRWIHEIWRGAGRARAEGADVRAVTIWSLLGAYDWDSLVTQPRGHYEPGVFDVRSGTPRPTALAGLVAALAKREDYVFPGHDDCGWWRRCAPGAQKKKAGRSVLITGGAGTLAKELALACELRGIPHRLLTRREMDIADGFAVAALLEELQPWAVINAAGYVRVDDAETDAGRCYRENVTGASILAGECASRDLPLICFSSDLVFDGGRNEPYRESDAVSPLSQYGRTKAAAETAVLELHPRALVVRTSAFFGPRDEYNFLTIALRRLREGLRFTAPSDAIVSPTYVPDLAHACLDLLIDRESGRWHLANPGQVSWAEFARMGARGAGLDEGLIEERPLAAMGFSAARPRFSALSSERGVLLPPLDGAVDRYLNELSRR